MNVSSTIPCLLGGLVGSLAFAVSIGAEPAPQPLLLAQQVVDGLPPPPLVFGQESPSAASAPTSAPTSDSQPTVPTMSPTDPNQRYLVVVNGDSSLLLSQVQAVVANASVQEYNGQRFIQAGMFDNPNTAQQQVATLAAQGIGAQIVTVNSAQLAGESQTGSSQTAPSSQAATTPTQPTQQATAPSLPPPDLLPAQPVPREVEFGQPPAPDQAAPVPSPSGDPLPPQGERADRSDSAYYVVIPGRSDDVEAITNQILRLGDGLDIAGMVQVDDARGSHVQIGPFVDRSAARRWNSYLREFGLRSRIYYKR